MGFSDFIGNEKVVGALRRMLEAERVPHALLFTGPRGVGKYTLARMFAQALNCERRGAHHQGGLFAAAGSGLTDDFCGACATCQQIARLADTAPLIERGLAERGAKPDAATVERVPLILQGHPDVWAVVPDPVRAQDPVKRPVIRMGQLRAVQRAAYFRPQARWRVFIVDGAETMASNNANIFLKILEEPPESSILILLAPSPFVLLDTIRSRCLPFFFAPLPPEQVEPFLKARPDLKPAQRELVAQLAGGSPGAALTLDLEENTRLRRLALGLIEQGAAGRKMGEVFARTAQLTKDEKDSFEDLQEMLYSLLNDLLELSHSPETSLLRNPDLRGELLSLSQRAELEWVARAVAQLDEYHSRLRRNVNRQLGLDAWAAGLAAPGEAATPSR